MPLTPNVRTKMKAALDAIEADAPGFYSRLALILARTNAFRAQRGESGISMTAFILDQLIDNALADERQRRQQELTLTKNDELNTQLEAEMETLKDTL